MMFNEIVIRPVNPPVEGPCHATRCSAKARVRFEVDGKPTWLCLYHLDKYVEELTRKK